MMLGYGIQSCGRASTIGFVGRFNRRSTLVHANICHGANDNRKLGDGFVPFVAFVMFTELTAALMLTLPNWHLST